MEIVAIILYPASQENILPIIRRKFSNEPVIRSYFYKGLREAWSRRHTIRQLSPDIICTCVSQITVAPRTSFLRALSLSYKTFGGKAFLIDEQGVVSRCSLPKFILFDISKLLLDLLFGILIVLVSYPFIILFRLYLSWQRVR